MASTLPPVVAVLLCDSKQFITGMGEAKVAMDETARSGSSSFGGLSDKAKTALLAVGAAALAVGVESVKLAADFQASMERLHTQAGVPQSEIAALSDQVLNLAGVVGDSPIGLSQALYHVESAFQSTGITASTAMDIVKTAAEGAKIGGANLIDVTNALDAAIVSGIPGVQDYQQAMGALNATVGAGDMTMQDLADALGTGVMPVVKNYGLTLDDVGAALATFGDNNIRGAQAATGLRMAVQALAVPTKAGQAALESYGIGTTQLARDMEHGGLVTALQDLKDHLEKAGVSSIQTGEIITQVFGKRAGVGVAVLYDQLDRLKSKYSDIQSGAQNFGDAWKRTTETFKFQMDQAVAKLEVFAIRLGDLLIPVITKVGTAVGDMIGFFARNQTAFEALVAIVGGAVIPVLGALAASYAIDAVAGFTSAVLGAVGALGEEAVAATGAGTALSVAGGIVGVAVFGIVEAMKALNQASSDAMATAEKAGHALSQAFDQSIRDSPNKIQDLTDKIKDLSVGLYAGSLANQVASTTGLTHAQVTNAMRIEAQDLAGQLVQLKITQQANTAQAADAARQAGLTTEQFQAQQAATIRVDNATKDTANALKDFNAALGVTIGDKVSVEQAMISFNQNLDQMSTKLRENKQNLDINTTAGRDDMTQILQTITAIKQQADAMAKGGASGDQLNAMLTTQIGRLDDTMRQAGLTTSQIDALNQQYGLTPKDVSTMVQVYGIADAENQLNQLAASLGQIGAQEAALPGMTAQALQEAQNRALATQGYGLGGAPAAAPAPSSWSTHNYPKYALGGYVPADTLAFLHAGETVIPPDVPISRAQPMPFMAPSAAPASTASSGPPGDLVLQVDRQTFARISGPIVLQWLQQQKRRQGDLGLTA